MSAAATPPAMPAIPIRAAGGIGADGSADLDLLSPARAARASDAQPVSLRELARTLGAPVPRLASRFTELATTGARAALARLAPLPAGTPLYLATGLGDVARTDGLYYQVMPPASEMASPAQFATSGNNIPAFFVAQQAGLGARNATISLEALSFERALMLARSDLAAGVAGTALVGGVDETTVPADFLVRRFPLATGARLGEGSAWIVIATDADDAIGALLDVRILAPGVAADARNVAAAALAMVAASTDESADGGAVRVLPGLRCEPALLDAITGALPAARVAPCLERTGCFPTAVALAMAATFARGDGPALWLHVARDRLGRAGLVCWRTHA